MKQLPHVCALWKGRDIETPKNSPEVWTGGEACAK